MIGRPDPGKETSRAWPARLVIAFDFFPNQNPSVSRARTEPGKA